MMGKTISNNELHEEIVNSVMNGLSQNSLRQRPPSSQQKFDNYRYQSLTDSNKASRTSKPESRYIREMYRPSHYQTQDTSSRFTEMSNRVSNFLARSHAALKNGDNSEAKHFATMARMSLKL
jgi:hypothetical protein